MSNFLTKNLFVPVAHFRRGRQAKMRPTFEAYQAGLEFRRAAQSWSEAEKLDWILQRLRFAVRHAAEETVYYRELFKQINFDAASDFSFDDFARLPILERETIHDAKEKLISNAVAPEQLERDATGGSTGTPTEIWLGAEERGWKEAAWIFRWKNKCSARLEDSVFLGTSSRPAGSGQLARPAAELRLQRPIL